MNNHLGGKTAISTAVSCAISPVDSEYLRCFVPAVREYEFLKERKSSERLRVAMR